MVKISKLKAPCAMGVKWLVSMMMDDIDSERSVQISSIMSRIVAFLHALRYSWDGTLGVAGTCYSLFRSFKYLFDESPAATGLSALTPRPTPLPPLVRSPSFDATMVLLEKTPRKKEPG